MKSRFSAEQKVKMVRETEQRPVAEVAKKARGEHRDALPVAAGVRRHGAPRGLAPQEARAGKRAALGPAKPGKPMREHAASDESLELALHEQGGAALVLTSIEQSSRWWPRRKAP